jgi:peroxiredoxin Q/BCP
VAQAKQLHVGDAAPDFALPDPSGKIIELSDFRGQAEVVLFFYPRDSTPGCTKEACAFRDGFAAFHDAGAVVIGISSDSAQSHQSFAQRLRLPFLLLSDSGGMVSAQYGVDKTLGILPGRVTFVIDKQGVVRHIFSSQFRPAKHVAEALRVLRELHGMPEAHPA